MVDNVSVDRRSQMMARVRSKNTSPEHRVRKVAHALGLRFRLHRNDLPGKPDLVFPRYKTVVFVHGCFWHQHPGCKRAQTPKSATEFWTEKFYRNTERDAKHMAQLEHAGWRVIVIWECETKSEASITKALAPLTGV